MYRFVLLCVCVGVILPVWASEPGQPLDCSDWVTLEPGFHCVPFVRYPCASQDPYCDDVTYTGFPEDNEGAFYELRIHGFQPGPAPGCYAGDRDLDQVELIRHQPGGSETVIGYIRERCVGAARDRIETCSGITNPRPDCLSFSPMQGRLLVKVLNSGPSVPQVPQVLAIHGLASTFEILQSYEPSTSEIGFAVPYMPEGFQFADFFDTYYGDLGSVGDWTQAQPLQCDYPAITPNVGDYLSVEDTLPTPAPGRGYYYVTAVNYQGQRRYGRKSIDGVLSGRDPAVLPGCIK